MENDPINLKEDKIDKHILEQKIKDEVRNILYIEYQDDKFNKFIKEYGEIEGKNKYKKYVRSKEFIQEQAEYMQKHFQDRFEIKIKEKTNNQNEEDAKNHP